MAAADKPVSEAKAKPAAPAPAAARADSATPPPVAQGVTKKPSNSLAQAALPLAADHATALAAPATSPAPQSSKRFNPQQQSDNLYKQAVIQLQQGHGNEARQSLRQALQTNPNHLKARQTLAGLLIEANALTDAAALLREGLQLAPQETGFSMSLARLQLENGDTAASLATLEKGLPHAGDEPQYHAFYAVLLQREKRHDDAVKHYLVALRSDPGMPTWLVGIGISLQAQGKDADAAEAYRRARDGGMLTPQLTQFVEQRLGQLK